MMDYEMFKDMVREKLMSHMPDELAGQEGVLLYGRNIKEIDHRRVAGTGAAAGGGIYDLY